MIEKDFDIPFVADLALHEKQIQQNYRPIIAVHKWFARRPGTLFRSLLLAEFAEPPLREAYFNSHSMQGRRIADPFMGGGTPLLEANRLGCDVVGYDINPMSYWIVREEMEQLDLREYRERATTLIGWLKKTVGHFYTTTCEHCGSPNATVKYFLWVKTTSCVGCHKDLDLFSGYLISEDRRHPKNVFVCPRCGELTETDDRKRPGLCRRCKNPIPSSGPARKNRCICDACGKVNSYPSSPHVPPSHRLFAIEYHCFDCKAHHRGRFFKKPDSQDLAKYEEATTNWQSETPRFVPSDEIPPGDETDRLHRWGYHHYRDLFNPRQLLGLELSCRAISRLKDSRLRNALATNLSDLLRYQNMLCRYDTMALKSLDIFSVHGYPVGLIQCESNFIGIRSNGSIIGSGGWSNIVEKYARAKAYCDNPFEIRHDNGRKRVIPVYGEWIGGTRKGKLSSDSRTVRLNCMSATEASIEENSLDAVLTDPPYFGNVQYAELIDFCYVWLRQIAHEPAFKQKSTRNRDELTGNETLQRGLHHFTGGLSTAFCKVVRGLKTGAPFVFTYHHNRLEAYYPVAVALLDARLVSTASLPCPAEMGASIHINRTGSSIMDSIFVCRTTGTVPRRSIASDAAGIAGLVADDIKQLQLANIIPTQGDLRCISYGHIVRMSIWHLRSIWNSAEPVEERLSIVARHIEGIGPQAVLDGLGELLTHAPKLQYAVARERSEPYQSSDERLSF
jgi:adenine-specific DNA methylase